MSLTVWATVDLSGDGLHKLIQETGQSAARCRQSYIWTNRHAGLGLSPQGRQQQRGATLTALATLVSPHVKPRHGTYPQLQGRDGLERYRGKGGGACDDESACTVQCEIIFAGGMKPPVSGSPQPSVTEGSLIILELPLSGGIHNRRLVLRTAAGRRRVPAMAERHVNGAERSKQGSCCKVVSQKKKLLAWPARHQGNAHRIETTYLRQSGSWLAPPWQQPCW